MFSIFCTSFCTFLCAFYALFFSVENLPVLPTSSTNTSDNKVTPQVLNYLRKYGYLSSDVIDSNALNNQRKLDFLIHDAIEKLQSFNNLPITGQIDNSTLEVINTPRCGLPDFIPANGNDRIKRYAIQGYKWPTNRITYFVKDNPPAVPMGRFRLQIYHAFKLWSKYSKLDFIEVGNGAADIIISIPPRRHGDKYDFDGPGGDLGHAYFPGPGMGGDIHLDPDELWIESTREENHNASLKPVFVAVLHEIGHSLGLEHTPDRDAIMYGAPIKHWHIDSELAQDDIDGIQYIYGARDGPIPSRRTTVYSHPTVSWPDPDQTAEPADHTAPETCGSVFDAVAYLRNEVFFFKRRHYWRLLLRTGRLNLDYPTATNVLWKELPLSYSQVDAAYQTADQYIIFFQGKQYWRYDGQDLLPGYPKSLASLGLPPNLPKLDAAFQFGAQQNAYFISGNKYWKFDEKTNRVEVSYPRNLSVWKGIPENIDAVFSYPKQDIAYFFKGKFFWEFDGRTMSVKSKTPKFSAHKWFNEFCSHVPDPSGFAHHSSPNTVLLTLLLILVPMFSLRLN